MDTKGCKTVYICAPYRGKDEAEVEKNIAYAAHFTAKAFEEGLDPVCVHIYTKAIWGLETNAPDLDRLIVKFNLQKLAKCDMMWVCGERITKGMYEEIKYCNDRGIRVVYTSWGH